MTSSRRNKTWQECWEVFLDAAHHPDADSAVRYVEALRLTDRDIVRLFLLGVGFAVATISMLTIVFWITWRALLWSLSGLV